MQPLCRRDAARYYRPVSTLTEIFSAGGALDHAVSGFRERPFQLDMARAIAQAIAGRTAFVAEAGTGTGKTFAYLVPALLSGGKVIISTGTKTLQDQLYGRDLPMVCAALKAPVATALLKGRANYVCHHFLERTLADGRLPSADDVRYLHRIASFARTSGTGDRAECADVPETAAVWSYVTSSRENCLGSNCRHYDRCFVMRARKQALEADVVVVNHHLFFADLVLRDEGVGELLPACNTVIFDEAHQLPETASLFFGESASTSQLIELARDLRVEAAAGARDARALPSASARAASGRAAGARPWLRRGPSAHAGKGGRPNGFRRRVARARPTGAVRGAAPGRRCAWAWERMDRGAGFQMARFAFHHAQF